MSNLIFLVKFTNILFHLNSIDGLKLRAIQISTQFKFITNCNDAVEVINILKYFIFNAFF